MLGQRRRPVDQIGRALHGTSRRTGGRLSQGPGASVSDFFRRFFWGSDFWCWNWYFLVFFWRYWLKNEFDSSTNRRSTDFLTFFVFVVDWKWINLIEFKKIRHLVVLEKTGLMILHFPVQDFMMYEHDRFVFGAVVFTGTLATTRRFVGKMTMSLLMMATFLVNDYVLQNVCLSKMLVCFPGKMITVKDYIVITWPVPQTCSFFTCLMFFDPLEFGTAKATALNLKFCRGWLQVFKAKTLKLGENDDAEICAQLLGWCPFFPFILTCYIIDVYMQPRKKEGTWHRNWFAFRFWRCFLFMAATSCNSSCNCRLQVV